MALGSKEIPAPLRSATGIIKTLGGESTFLCFRLQALPSRGETAGHRRGNVHTEQEGRARRWRLPSSLAGTAQEGPPFPSKPMPGVLHTNPVFPKPNSMELLSSCLKVYILYHRPLTLYVGKTFMLLPFFNKQSKKKKGGALSCIITIQLSH